MHERNHIYKNDYSSAFDMLLMRQVSSDIPNPRREHDVSKGKKDTDSEVN